MKTFIKNLIKYINDNSKFNTIFNHFNQTYLIENFKLTSLAGRSTNR